MSRCAKHPKQAIKKTTCAPCRSPIRRGKAIWWERGRPLCETCARERGIAR